ncbi:uncharacterized protein LOC130895144 [Diorhabda carinulata]|uniref:uncharacterized protein LOC130895144 n=1 Tax=Diorhabda carinulata TaxID=1163345 RepID=UPI0025A2F7A4|nr:uncharacterized protein LOC130895144 [Diorhabda carinulata]
MRFALFIGLVFAIHHANAGCLSCSSSCSHGAFGSYVEERHEQRHGCGFPFPLHKDCGREEVSHSDWGSDGLIEKDCVPLVVRPHDIPKPTLNPLVAVDLNKVVPNPSAIKKAIVKPAVLPKPVCKANGQGGGVGYGVGCGAGCGAGCGCGCAQTCCGSLNGAGPCYGNGITGLNGAFGVSGAYGLSGVAGAAGASGKFGFPGGPGGPYGPYGFGPFAPADAVSLDIATKLAREANQRQFAVEDRLNFGFRKLPLELPPKKIIQANVPEEGIFQLNGAVVELKPIKSTASSSSPAALAEEAAEQLLALEEEEANAGTATGAELQPGIRSVSLGEIGYGLATPPKPNLITVPDSAASVGSQDISTNCGCGQYGYASGCGGVACGQVGGCASCNEEKCDCKIIPGNVEIEIKPKPQQICLPVPEVPDSCDSAELEIEEEDHGGISCSCVPVCVHRHKQCNCKKTCYTVEKLFG